MLNFQSLSVINHIFFLLIVGYKRQRSSIDFGANQKPSYDILKTFLNLNILYL